MARALIVGLDALDPGLVVAWLDDLPNLRALMARGVHGRLESTVPPVTPVAWTAMTSGRNPGHFGFTDSTYRQPGGYTRLGFVHSGAVRVPTLAQVLPVAGLRYVSVGVPVTYPPVAIPGGACVSCSTAPSLSRGITHPGELQGRVLDATSSPYLLDVPVRDGVEELDRGELLRQIRELDRQRFDVTAMLMDELPWDVLFSVCMGTDRVGHYFMRYQDPEHVRHVPDGPYGDAMRAHYAYCDRRLGELLERLPGDAAVVVVSDHGMQRLDGRVALNDWLAARGYLALRHPVPGPVTLAEAPVDWSRTVAWAHGYGGQVFVNVRGRERDGCVEPDEVAPLLDRIVAELRETLPLGLLAVRGGNVYTGPQSSRCPDLLLRIENGRYLVTDRLGNRELVTSVAELGVDDGSHAPQGFLAVAGPGVPALGRFEAIDILDVVPTLLRLLGLEPAGLEGRPLQAV